MKQKLVLFSLTIILVGHLWAQSGMMPGDSLLNVDRVGPQNEKIDENIYKHFIYVSRTTGSDKDGDGSKDNPWQSLTSALLNITDESKSNRTAMLVASAVYEEGTIYMQEWIDLYGGFNPETWERDPVQYRSVLDGGGLRRVVVGRNNSRIDGFVIANGLSR